MHVLHALPQTVSDSVHEMYGLCSHWLKNRYLYLENHKQTAIDFLSFNVNSRVTWYVNMMCLSLGQCIWDRTASRSYSMFVGLGLIVAPLCLMLLAYCHMFYYIHNTKSKLYKYKFADADEKKRFRYM